MPTVLILSSYVAASRVGGGAQALAFSRLGIEPILVPTVLFGRHPGWGAPGGGPVAAETMQAMLDAIAYQGLFSEIDAVVTGYFSRADQVTVATRTLAFVRAANPKARLIVDPVMGDAGKGLYVGAAVAEAVGEELVPRADLITPNAWELSRLSEHPVFDAKSAVAAARALGRPVVVSSIEAGGEIGVVYADANEAHLRRPSAPGRRRAQRRGRPAHRPLRRRSDRPLAAARGARRRGRRRRRSRERGDRVQRAAGHRLPPRTGSLAAGPY